MNRLFSRMAFHRLQKQLYLQRGISLIIKFYLNAANYLKTSMLIIYPITLQFFIEGHFQIYDRIRYTLDNTNQMPPITNPSDFCNKLSQLSGFASQSFNQKLRSDSEPAVLFALQNHDYITLQHSDRTFLGLNNIQKLLPAAIPESQIAGLSLSLFQISAVTPDQRSIRYSEAFHLLHLQSNLYLSAQSPTLKSFTNISLERTVTNATAFVFEPQQKEDIVYNKRLVKIKNTATGLYLRGQTGNNDNNKGSLWLSQSSNSFLITIMNRQQLLPIMLNNSDILLITSEVKGETKYIGVSKHHAISEFSQHKGVSNELHVDLYKQYYGLENCDVDYFSAGQKECCLVNCLWQVQKLNQQLTDCSFLVRAREGMMLRHLETGLCLSVDGSGTLTLKRGSELKMQNIQKYCCPFSQTYNWQPIYINHPVKMGLYNTNQSFGLQRLEGRVFVRLYCLESLSFIYSLTQFLGNPRGLEEHRETLCVYINLYCHMYELYRQGGRQMSDRGFYFFQFTLKILLIVKHLLKDEKANLQDKGLQIRRKMLQPLMMEMIKFMSLVIATSSALAQLTADDHRKTKEIIQVLMVLYALEPQHALHLLVALSNADPQLVVKLLAERMVVANKFEQRVDLLKAISQIIDQHRRISFDEETLKSKLEREHQLVVTDETLVVHFQRKEHDLFNLLRNLDELDSHHSDAEQKQQYYFHIYLLIVAKILFNARKLVNTDSDEPCQRDNASIDARRLVCRLRDEFIINRNIDARIKALGLMSELLAQICSRQFIFSSRLAYTVMGSSLEETTSLAELLTLGREQDENYQSANLEWVFSQTQLMTVMDQTLSSQWQLQHKLKARLKFFTCWVDLLTTCVTTATYNMRTLHSMEDFCIAVCTIFYRQRLHCGCLKQTRQLLTDYAAQVDLVLTDGLKAMLDELINQLNCFFAAVLVQKKRLYVYPLYTNRAHTFRFDHFRNMYSQLVLNQRLRTEISPLQQLLLLNSQELQVVGLVLLKEKAQGECLRLVEAVIEDLDYLSIMMESYHMYSQDKALKDKVVTSMKLKIFKVEQKFNEAHELPHFPKITQAFNLAAHLLDFILENSFEQELLSPLIEILLERTSYNCGILAFLREKQELFFQFICNPKGSKNAHTLLQWVGRQIQHIPEPILPQHVDFLFQKVAALVETDSNANVLYLVSMLKELGLQNREKEEMLYSKLIQLSPAQDFLNSCTSARSLKLFRDKFQKDKLKCTQLSLQLMAIFRICETHPHLMAHLRNRLPYTELLEAASAAEITESYLSPYSFFQSALSYLITDPRIGKQKGVLNHHLHFVSSGLTQAKGYMSELGQYQSKSVNKANTHCSKTSYPVGLKSLVPSESHSFFWEYVLWVPFYCRPEGLLIYLERLLKIIIDKNIQEKEIEETLELIFNQFKKQILPHNEINPEQHRTLIAQMTYIMNLIQFRKITATSLTASLSKESIKYLSQEHLDELYKIVNENHLMKPFLQIVREASLATAEAGVCISSISIQLPKKEPKEESILDESANSRLGEKTLQSLITHSMSNKQNSRKTLKQQKLNLLNFLNSLKSILGYRLRLSLKLQAMLVQYFSEKGTLHLLQQRFMEEINNFRDRATSYREEKLDYQFSWRCMKPVRKEIVEETLMREHLTLQTEVVSVHKLQELLHEQKLHILCNLTQDLLKLKANEGHSRDFRRDYCRFQAFFLKLLQISSTDENKLTMVLKSAENLLEILIIYKDKDRALQIERELYSRLSMFIYQASNITDSQTKANFLLQLVFFVNRVQYKYSQKFKPEIDDLMMSGVVPQLPKNSLVFVANFFVKLDLEMARSQGRYNSRDFESKFKFNELSLTIFFEQDFFSENMLFHEHSNYVTTMLDFLQLLLTNTLTLPHPIPTTLLALIIQLECTIYQKVLNDPIQYINPGRVALYESMIIQSLSLFTTLSVLNGDKVWTNRMLQQRLDYIEGEPTDLMHETYSYYQKKYCFCLLQNERGRVMAQAYPYDSNFQPYVQQFSNIVSTYQDIEDKKNVILNCSVMVSEIEHRRSLLISYMYTAQPIAIILSAILVAFAVIDRMLDSQPHHSTFIFKMLMMANLVLVAFLITERVLRAVAIGELQYRINRQTSLLRYLWREQKGFALLSLLLLSINSLSMYDPTYASLLVMVHLFSKRKLTGTLIRMVMMGSYYLIGLFLCLCAVLFFFVLFYQPDESGSTLFIVPIYSPHNIKFIETGTNIWRSMFYNNSKAQFYMMLTSFIKYFYIATLIFYYIYEGTEDRTRVKSCELCNPLTEEEEGRNEHQTINHIKYEHNIFNFLSCFRYVLLKREDLATQQEIIIRDLIRRKKRILFS